MGPGPWDSWEAGPAPWSSRARVRGLYWACDPQGLTQQRLEWRARAGSTQGLDSRDRKVGPGPSSKWISPQTGAELAGVPLQGVPQAVLWCLRHTGEAQGSQRTSGAPQQPTEPACTPGRRRKGQKAAGPRGRMAGRGAPQPMPAAGPAPRGPTRVWGLCQLPVAAAVCAPFCAPGRGAEREWAPCPGVHGSEWTSVLACVGDCVAGRQASEGPV